MRMSATTSRAAPRMVRTEGTSMNIMNAATIDTNGSSNMTIDARVFFSRLEWKSYEFVVV